jgi:hypothetical protein
MMKNRMDITNNITRFREAARHLWNTYFLERAERDKDWDLRDQFSNVYVDLFNSLVKYDLPESVSSIPHLWNGENKVLSEYQVKGKNKTLAAMINRTLPATGYWDHPIQQIKSDETDVRLISFFDWDELGFRDMRYLRVRIVASPNKELIGRDALIEADSCNINYEKED